MQLTLLPDSFAICRLAPDAAVPPRFFSVTRTAEELSVVCREADVPSDARCELGWSGLQVAGPLDFALTGVLAALAAPLAAAGVSIFALSTFDTDYLLVKSASLPEALAALRGAGHEVVGEGERSG
ncbi:MAG: ACT domain-containing protein [Verrucomicrobia bacterium]|nr:ACT domain-containing protein [Verrucomicrobiota bacterium]